MPQIQNDIGNYSQQYIKIYLTMQIAMVVAKKGTGFMRQRANIIKEGAVLKMTSYNNICRIGQSSDFSR